MSHPPGLTIHPSRAPLGAEIVGVDLAADVDEPTFRAIEDAYNTHTVVVMRHQHLTPEHVLRFARRFGSLERSPRTQYALPGYPEILLLSNIAGRPRPAHRQCRGGPHLAYGSVVHRHAAPRVALVCRRGAHECARGDAGRDVVRQYRGGLRGAPPSHAAAPPGLTGDPSGRGQAVRPRQYPRRRRSRTCPM